MPQLEFIYQYVVTVLEVNQRIALCAKLLCVDVETLRAWIARIEEHQE